ncbi:MAG: hypothetical protein ACJ04O_06045 [Cellvibrionales bacterium]|nr:hypothetical protein [Porticoccaceae bacterium]
MILSRFLNNDLRLRAALLPPMLSTRTQALIVGTGLAACGLWLINPPWLDAPSTEPPWLARYDQPDSIDDLQRSLEHQLLDDQVSDHFPSLEQVDQQVAERSLEDRLTHLTRTITTRAEPSAAELGNFYQRHREAYREAAHMSLRQVVYTSAVHGGMALATAQKALEASRDGSQPIGDNSRLASHYNNLSSLALGDLIGMDASGKIVALARKSTELPCWGGPISSSVGVHLVCIERFALGAVPHLNDVRTQVINDWRHAAVEQAADSH